MKIRNKHYNIAYFILMTLFLSIVYQKKYFDPLVVFLLFILHCIICIANGYYFYLISFSNTNCNRRDFYSSVKIKTILANISEYFDNPIMAKRYILFVRMIPFIFAIASVIMMIIFLSI